MITTLVYRDHRLTTVNPPPDSLAALRTEPGVTLWVDLSQPTVDETRLVLEQIFAFHPLVVEDCVSDLPLPKLEDYDEYLYIVMHAVDYSRADKFSTTELDLMLGKNFLVSFHKQPLRPVQAAIERHQRGAATTVRGPDRFAHTLLDGIIEAYKPALDELRVELEEIEEYVLHKPYTPELFRRVIELRKELAQLRSIVRPQRSVAAELSQGKTRFIRAVILPYLRDLTEEFARIESQAQTWADRLILAFRVFLNKSSHEANEGIRVLTGLTALTIPVLMIAGWFGMNFHDMPWLHTPEGYIAASLLTAMGTIGMLVWLRRRRWL